MQLEPVARTSVADAAFAQLRAEILAGRLPAGDALPSERTLTEIFGVNRQAVREALKRLDQAGLVEIAHGGATRVRDYRVSAGLDLLPALLQRDGTFDAGTARAIVEMRACIGPDVARLCAVRAVPDDVARLHATVRAMHEPAAREDLGELAALDWELWGGMVDGADNIAYRLAFNSLRATAGPLDELLLGLRRDELLAVPRRAALVRAIAAGDGSSAESIAREILGLGSAGIVLALSMPDLAGSPPSPGARP